MSRADLLPVVPTWFVVVLLVVTILIVSLGLGGASPNPSDN